MCTHRPIFFHRDAEAEKKRVGDMFVYVCGCMMCVCVCTPRPIFFDPDAEAEKKRLREEAIRRAREASRAHEQNQETIKQSQGGQDPSKIRYGQQGYRYVCAVFVCVCMCVRVGIGRRLL